LGFRTATFRAILDEMMARPLVGATIATVLATGCGKQLNPAYCDDHPNDPDCRSSGFVEIDAPLGECRDDSMCSGNPNGSVCELGSQTCVQCLEGKAAACTGATPQCGTDHLCHGCLVDAHCSTSNVCLPNGECADPAKVLYAGQAGTGSMCTQAAPCTFTTAVASVDTSRYIIKLISDGTAVFREPPITIGPTTAPAVQILGHSAKFEPNTDGDAITVTSGNVEIVGLTVQKAQSGKSGIVCTENGVTVLTLRQVSLIDNGGYGVTSTSCTVTIERSRISRNASAAMLLAGGTIEIRNNIVDGNGNGQLENGNVQITASNGRVVFNTIVQNLAKGGSDRTGGIACTGTVRIARNILSDNGASNPFRGDCTTGTLNFTNTDVTVIKFKDLMSYELTDMTPATILRDDPESGPDCMLATKYISDYKGDSRPFNYCDRGADEYRP
jgi:hypothetical protein